METNTPFNTSILWEAVGSQAVSQVLPKMEKDGWTCISVGKGSLKFIVLARERQMVRLFAKNEQVGMVHVMRDE